MINSGLSFEASDKAICYRSLFCAVLALSMSATFIFKNISLQGVGLPILVFVLLLYASMLVVASNRFCLSIPVPLVVLGFLTFLYHVSLTAAFYSSGSTSADDLKYVLSSLSNFVWLFIFFIIAQNNKSFVYNALKLFVYILIIFMCSFWIYLALYHHDLFFMREIKDVFAFGEATFFSSPNLFARTCCILLVFFCFYSHYELYLCKDKFYNKSVILFVMVLCSVMILSTGSRTNIFALVVFLAFFLTYKRSLLTKALLLSLIVFLVSLFFFYSQVRESVAQAYSRISKVTIDGPVDRLPLRARTWSASLQIILDYPLTGVGFSRASDFMAEYGSVKQDPNGQRLIKIHGGFLKVGIYGGVFSLFFYILLFFGIYFFSISNVGRHDLLSSMAAVYCSRLIVVLFIQNIAADNLHYSFTWMLTFILFSLIFSRTVSARRARLIS